MDADPGVQSIDALELGLIVPPVRTRDNLELPPGTYAILIHGVEMARGEAPAGKVLAAEELADEYGVSAERIRQIEANAIKKLRTAMAV